MTFDLEEWFYLYSTGADFEAEHYWKQAELRAEAITNELLHILKASGATATFFCMGRFARAYPDLLKRIVDQGHEIGAHSDIHEYANRQSLKTFRQDLVNNLDTLEEITGIKIQSYRTPAFSINTLKKQYRSVLTELGIKYDSSLKSGTKTSFGNVPNYPFRLKKDNSITFFPVSTWPLLPGWPYAGSGFFRVMPMSLIMNELSTPAYHMMYFHPRDFDIKMRVLPAEFWNRVKYGIGTKSAFSRLELILKQFRCLSIVDASDEAEIEITLL